MEEVLIEIFLVAKFVSLILSFFFLLGIIYYWRKIKTSVFSYWHHKWSEIFGLIPLQSLQVNKEWAAIENYLKEPYPSSWKIAVLEAGALVEKLLIKLGFKVNDWANVLKALENMGLRNLSILNEAHEVQTKILLGPNYNLNIKEAERIVAIYKKFWHDLITLFF